jgi:hypothetical protein
MIPIGTFLSRCHCSRCNSCPIAQSTIYCVNSADFNCPIGILYINLLSKKRGPLACHALPAKTRRHTHNPQGGCPDRQRQASCQCQSKRPPRSCSPCASRYAGGCNEA